MNYHAFRQCPAWLLRTVWLTALLLCCGASPYSAAAGPVPADPVETVIRETNAALLEIMKRSSELTFEQRYEILEQVMRKAFYFSFMLRKSCGSYWLEMDEAQHAALLEKYIGWSVGTYVAQFDKYNNHHFSVDATEVYRNDYRIVTSTLQNDNKSTTFHYILAAAPDGWRIIDIQINGVSQLSQSRAQIKAVLKAEGPEGLLRNLDEKIRGLRDEE
jgi:phospholipid transport system substrate-binding protein